MTPRTSRSPTRPCSDLFPDNDRLHKWIRRRRRSGSPSRACRPASAGSATASATRPACAFNELVRTGRGQRPDRHRPRPPRLRLGRQPRTARPRRWLDGSDAIADWPLLNALRQHRLRRHAGSRSTTAAASASAARCTPARSRSPTAPTSPRRSSRACSPTTPAWASSATSTPATTSPTEVAHERGVRIPMQEG